MLTIGQVVDRYEILSVIGEGGMAVVLEVRHRELGTRHALKVLQISFPGIHERLLHEGQVQATIRHPNVCRVTDVVRVSGAPGLVMELVDGPAVDGMLRHYRPSLPQLDALARGIVAGVRAAHAAGVVHRDLKPANVLVAVQDDRVVPKVTDFGLAKALDDGMAERGRLSTRSGTHMGTPAFMAPEQFRDAKRADQRADIFSLGCLLYELVSGVPAFTGADALDVYESTSTGRFLPLGHVVPNVPHRMARAVAAALAPDPDDRLASCDALLEMWCDDVPDERVSVAWEPSHLALVHNLAPTSERARRVSVTIAPSLPSAPPLVADHRDRVAPAVAAVPPSRTMGYTTAGVAVGIGAAGIAAAAGIVLVGTAIGGWLWMESAKPAPPTVVAVEVPVAAPPVPPVVEEVVASVALAAEPPPEPVKAPSRPRSVPFKAAPPLPAATADPVVTVQGLERAWLVRSDGARFKPGEVAPGTYVLQAFFDEAQPIRVMELTVTAGETLTVRCDRVLKVCR